jgi:hypothetical protein
LANNICIRCIAGHQLGSLHRNRSFNFTDNRSVSKVMMNLSDSVYRLDFFNLLFFIYRATASTLGNIPFTDIYESINLCDEVNYLTFDKYFAEFVTTCFEFQKKKAREFQGIKIIRYESSIFYANVENFTYKVIKLSGVDTNEILKKINKLKTSYESQIKNLKPNKVILSK